MKFKWIFLIFINITLVMNFTVYGQENLPFCTVQSIDGLLPPVPSFPIGQRTGLISRVPLLPVPIERTVNPAFFPIVPQNSLLEIVGRADPQFGEWLYVEVRIPEQLFLYGFVRHEQTGYTGDINTLPIISVERCRSSGNDVSPLETTNRPTEFTTRIIDQFYVSLPSNWVYFDQTVTGEIHSGIASILENPPQVGGLETEIIFASAPENDDDVRYFSIFYVAILTESFIPLSEDINPEVLALELQIGIEEIQDYSENNSEFDLTEAFIVEINDYPFLFSHFTRENALPPQVAEENNILSSINILDIYQLITYQNGQWYLINLTGLRAGSQLHQTVMSSIFTQ